MHCTYKIGKDLEVAVAAVGAADTGISFLRSNIDGDYYARFGVQHGCVIIANGAKRAKTQSIFDFAFISPKTGRAYKSWQECQRATRG